MGKDWVVSPKSEDTSPLPNYGTSTIMIRCLCSKGAPFLPLTPLSCLVERDQGHTAPWTDPETSEYRICKSSKKLHPFSVAFSTNSLPLLRRPHSSELWGLLFPLPGSPSLPNLTAIWGTPFLLEGITSSVKLSFTTLFPTHPPPLFLYLVLNPSLHVAPSALLL